MEFDFSKYRIHIPKEKFATGRLIAPNEGTYPLNEAEIYPYNKGIEMVKKDVRGLWLSDDISRNRELRKEIKEYFQKMGIIAN